jgi:hypothetical protein
MYPTTNNDTLVSSWYDLPIVEPYDPREIIANGQLGVASATFTRSATFLQSAWAANTWVLTGAASVISLRTDNIGTIANAAQWNMAHKMVNNSANNPIPLRKVVFMRSGINWVNNLGIDFGADTYTDIQLSYRDNGATSGSFLNAAAGGMPVVAFAGNFTGIQTLQLTFKAVGRVQLAIVAKKTYDSSYSMFELDCICIF